MLSPVQIFMIFLLAGPKSGPDLYFMVLGPARISNFSKNRIFQIKTMHQILFPI